jgi:hypothetical protein
MSNSRVELSVEKDRKVKGIKGRHWAYLNFKVDYEKTFEKVKKSPLVKNYVVGGKDWVTFYLKKHPNYPIQVIPDGTVKIYFNTTSELSEMLSLLHKILVQKKKPAWYPLAYRRIQTQEVIENVVKLPLKSEVYIKVKDKKGHVIKEINVK